MLANRHIISSLVAAGLLAGCGGTSELQDAVLPSKLNVVEVTIDMSDFEGVEGRELSRTEDEIAADVGNAVATALAEKSDPSGAAATVEIALKRIELANPVSRAVAQSSNIRADVSVVTEDAVRIVPMQAVVGNSDGIRLAGTLGVLTTPGVDKDYSDTVAGFAMTLQQLLFEGQ